MMISPEAYIAEFENKSLPKLIKERDSLIRDIRKLEKVLFSPEKGEPVPRVNPAPEVEYQMYLEYLSALCVLIEKRFTASMNAWNDEED